jgi:CHAD domain-containing protein
MAYRFAPGEAGAGVQRVMVEQVGGTMRSIITAAAGSDDEFDDSTHDARKRLKRVRALLRLVEEPLGEDVYRAENARYRDVGRLLGPARDARVARDLHLSVVGPSDRLDSQLVAARQAVRAGAVLEKLLRDLADGLGTVGGWYLEGDEAALFAAGLRRTYRRGRRALRAEKEEPAAEHRHEWRKAVKYHWHHLELLAGAWPAVFEAQAAEAHRLADLLGDEHDLTVLAALLAEPHPELATRSAELRRDALILGRRLYAETPSALADRFRGVFRAA